MVFDNPLRQELTRPVLGDVGALTNGGLAVPDTPGIGVELDQEALRRFTIDD
jgi:galactonate dehydratase